MNAISFPPIDYRHRRLANGLEVYSVQDKSSPTVAIQVWYRVGSKDDPEGRSGFAHLFEHIMFKSTRHMPDEMMDRLTEDVGGFNNAATADDFTKYYEVVPSHYLETLLWAEGERMGSLRVDEGNFRSERDVVKEEYRFRVLAPSYGRFFYAIDRDSFAVHPYRRPGIGSMEELDAATIDDVVAFHRTYYRPDNAVLIVVGDFDHAKLERWVDRYFGGIARPETPIPRVHVVEPPRAEARRFVELGPNVPLPAVAITWLAPSAATADADALSLAATILAHGESSRLYQSLVYRDAIAQQASAYPEMREDLGLFIVTAILATGKSPEEAEGMIQKEIESLASGALSEGELEKAKNLIITSALRARETNDGKANEIGEAVILRHDVEDVNHGLERLQRISAEDVQRSVRLWLCDGKPYTITYLADPESSGADESFALEEEEA